MNREAQGVVMLLVGGAILRASVTDLYLRYVRAGLRPLLLVAGVVLIVAALATFWYELRARRQHDRHDQHGHREPRVAWLLLLPLFALILVSPPALGSYAASRTGSALQPPLGFPPLPKGDPLAMGVLDYATRAVYDHGHSLGGRQFTLTGFISQGPGGAPYLTRMVFSCCAADALPVKVGLAGRVPASLKPDTWLEVTGAYTSREVKDRINNTVIPYLDVTSARPTPVPGEPYEV